MRGDFQRYLIGQGIDIGAGPDCLQVERGNVRAWDMPDGDAQYLQGVPDNFYDFVYSSHCLEHMVNVEISLTNWLRVLKPGGHLYTVIPDYILYEKLTWPSRFNIDHKQSFSFLITRAKTQRNNHWHINDDLLPLHRKLGAEPVAFHVEDRGFNYNVGPVDQTSGDALSQLCIIARKNDL